MRYYMPKTEMGAIRMREGLRQSDVSQHLGISLVTYNCAEAGRLSPNKHTRQRIEEWFGLPWDDLMVEPEEVTITMRRTDNE